MSFWQNTHHSKKPLGSCRTIWKRCAMQRHQLFLTPFRVGPSIKFNTPQTDLLLSVPIFDARPYFDPAATTHLSPHEFKMSSVATTCELYEEELPGEAFVAVIYSANSWKKKEPSKENSFDFPNISMNLYAVVLLALPSS